MSDLFTKRDTTMNNQRMLTAIVALQVLGLASQWTGHSTLTPTMAGELPDPGARQMQMVDELKQLNSKLGRLNDFLESGKLKVVVPEPDQKK
jgi:hypothetical protein